MPEENLKNILAQIRRNIESLPASPPKEAAQAISETPASEAPSPPAQREPSPAARPPVPMPDEDLPDRELYAAEDEGSAPQERYTPRSIEPADAQDAGSGSLRSELWLPLGQASCAGLAVIAAYREDFTLLALALAGWLGVILAGALLTKGSPYMALRSVERRLENLERRLDSLKFSSGGVSSELEEEIKELRGILRSLVGSLEGPKNGE